MAQLSQHSVIVRCTVTTEERMSEKSISELLEDTFGMPEAEVERLRSELFLSKAAYLLSQRGNGHAAALLLDVELMTLDRRCTEDYDWLNGGGETWSIAVLDVEPYLVERFTEERLAEITSALRSVGERERVDEVRGCRMREALADPPENWREALLHSLGGTEVTNAARKTRILAGHPQQDGLHFTNAWEQRVYRVLREKQAALPGEQTLGILPLPAFRTMHSTYEPDFLVTYRGRAGVIEVDGPHHAGAQRRSSDASREALLINAGVAWVERIDVRDTTTKEEVEALVDRFLLRLTERA